MTFQRDSGLQTRPFARCGGGSFVYELFITHLPTFYTQLTNIRPVRSAHCESVERISDAAAAQSVALDTDPNAGPFGMIANRNRSLVGGRDAPSFPSRTNTANGYSLVPEPSPLDGTPDCRFRVVDPAGTKRIIKACFDRSLVMRIDRKRSTRLWIASRFWVLCAERHLAAYLTEVGDCPPSGQLVIAELDEDEVLLAAYWQD